MTRFWRCKSGISPSSSLRHELVRRPLAELNIGLQRRSGMPQDPKCVFCRILSGRLSARVVAQNEGATAILDAFPLAVGHTLVISRSHIGKVQDLSDAEAGSLFDLTLKATAAAEATTQTNASTIAIHNGSEAGQEIPHVHVHIVPRSREDGAGPVHSMFHKRPALGPQEMDALCAKMAAQFS